MFRLGVAGATPRELSWLLAVDLPAAGVQVGDPVPDVRTACLPERWAEADGWLFWPHQLSAQDWRDLEDRRRSCDRPLVASCQDQAGAVAALRHGVRCLTLPEDSAWSWKAAIVAAADGQPFLSPALLQDTLPCLLPVLTADGADRRPAHCLTARELDVLRLLAGGATNAGIGADLYISPATVGTHVISILRKLGVTNRTQAAASAHRMGLAGDDATADRLIA